jgi:hypothetical protein
VDSGSLQTSVQQPKAWPAPASPLQHHSPTPQEVSELDGHTHVPEGHAVPPPWPPAGQSAAVPQVQAAPTHGRLVAQLTPHAPQWVRVVRRLVQVPGEPGQQSGVVPFASQRTGVEPLIQQAQRPWAGQLNATRWGLPDWSRTGSSQWSTVLGLQWQRPMPPSGTQVKPPRSGLHVASNPPHWPAGVSPLRGGEFWGVQAPVRPPSGLGPHIIWNPPSHGQTSG